MRWVHALGAAVAATTLVGSVAQATISVSLVPIQVNSTAAAAISSGTVRTFQLKVTQSAGEKWNVGAMKVTLATNAKLSGYFYASPNHDNSLGRNTNFNNAYLNTDPNFYDTFVSTPQFDVSPTGATQASNLNVTGSSDFPTGPGTATPVVPSSSTNANGSNQTLDIVWGDEAGNQATTATDGSTSYIVAQFTIVGNTGAFIRGYSGGTAASNTPLFFPNNGTGPIAAASQGTLYLPIRGDINLDGTVDQSDLNVVTGNFAKSPRTFATGDLTGDGLVDQSDLNQVTGSFTNGIGAPPAGALGSLVPEPSICGLLLAGLTGIMGRRRKA
jgi:hypothetical protein